MAAESLEESDSFFTVSEPPSLVVAGSVAAAAGAGAAAAGLSGHSGEPV